MSKARRLLKLRKSRSTGRRANRPRVRLPRYSICSLLVVTAVAAFGIFWWRWPLVTATSFVRNPPAFSNNGRIADAVRRRDAEAIARYVIDDINGLSSQAVRQATDARWVAESHGYEGLTDGEADCLT